MLDKTVIHFFKIYVKKHKSVLFYAIIISIAQSLLLIPSLYFIKQIFDVSLPQSDMNSLLINAGIILSITVLQGGMVYLHRGAFLKIVKSTIRNLQKDVLAKLIWANTKFYDENCDATTVNTAVTDVDKVDRMMDGVLSVVIPQFILFIVGLVIMIIYNPLIGLVTLLLSIIGGLIQRMNKRKIRKYIEFYRKVIDEMTSYVNVLPQKHVLTKLRDFQSQELVSASNLGGQVIDSGTEAAKRGLAIQVLSDLIINISATTLIVVGSIQILLGKASLGNIFGLYFLIVFIRKTVAGIQSQWVITQEGSVSLGRIFKLLSTNEVETFSGLSNTTAFNFDGSVRANKLSFDYGNHSVLVDASFEISPGEIVTINGENGSGKSSLINLILGLYQPISGELFATGKNYLNINISKLRTQIGYVPQLQVLLDGTIVSNLTYGLSEEEKKEALQIVDSSIYNQLMRNFPDGLQTKVSLAGKNLSNGQIQRISILRALIARPKLLILDEPTNHLDSQAIIALLNEIKTKHDLSVLIITHHHSFKNVSDRTYLLQSGKLSVLE